MVELYLVRHGQTVFNVEKRVQGYADSDLTATGVADAKALGRGLAAAGVVIEQAFASDRKRAIVTAQTALKAAQQDLNVNVNVALREMDYGKFEGWQTDDFAKAAFDLPSFDEAMARGVIDLDSIAGRSFALNEEEPINYAENSQMAVTRFGDALTALARRADELQEERLLVVTHGTIILMWLDAIGFDVKGVRGLSNASVTQIHVADHQFSVKSFNDLSYVEAGRQLPESD